MRVDNSAFEIKDDNDKTLITVNGDNSDIAKGAEGSTFIQREAGIFADGSNTKKSKKSVYTSASENRTVISKSGGLSFKAMDGSKLMDVQTTASKADVELNEQKKTNNVNIALGNGDTFSVNLGDVSENKAVQISGTGNGAGEGAQITLNSGGKLELANVEVQNIELNGKEDDGNGKDINGIRAYLNDYVFEAKGDTPIKPAVTVEKDGKRLTEGSDYVVAYNNNVKPGEASAVVYGLEAFTGSRELKFTITKEPVTKHYKMVHFYLNGHGRTAPEDGLAETGKTVEKPASPIGIGWKFDGWFTDEECTKAYDFASAVNSDITLYAKWIPIDGMAVCFSNDPSDGEVAVYNRSTGHNEAVYTGHKVEPAVIVTNGDTQLELGVDYTLKYENNTKVSKENSPAKVTVTGKGSFAGSRKLTFYVVPKKLSLSDDEITVGGMVVEAGKKLEPVIGYNDYELKTGDYDITSSTGSLKFKESDKANNPTVTITGKGNFTGEIKDIPVVIKTKAEMSKSKISVTLGKDVNKSYYYNGAAQKLKAADLAVKSVDGTALQEGTDYKVKYKNNINAGKAKVIVTGINGCTGRVTKTFRILPDSKSDVTVKAAKDEAEYSPKGAVPELTVTAGGRTLKKGKDYKVSCKDNKKISTEKKKAKYKVTFIGNYKGQKQKSDAFIVKQAELKNVTVSAPDMIYTKPGKYRSEPYVMIGDTMLTKKDYNVSYNIAGEELKGNLSLGEGETSKKITVTVTGKGKYTGGPAQTDYLVLLPPAGSADLSKAKIIEKDAAPTKKSLPAQAYTGRAVRPAVDVYVKQDKDWIKVDDKTYSVGYLNNKNKGQATLIVTGDGKSSFGSRTTKFTIGSANFKNLDPIDIMRSLGIKVADKK